MPSYEWSHEHNAFVKACPSCQEVYVGANTEVESIEVFKKDFRYNAKWSDGFHASCTDCRITSTLKWRGAKIGYGDKKRMFVQQKGLCPICGCEMIYRGKSTSPKTACIDHDPETGDVCGLICNLCNLALGHFDRNVTRLKQAILYLTRIKRRV